MNTPLISVLIPAYNVERWLGECLDSILSQSERRIEVLVADDGSTDGTGAILERYAARDARLRSFRLPHAGAYVARNRLLGEAKGEWIYFCDADDRLVGGAFARLLAAAEADGLDAVYFGADVFYESEELAERFAHFQKRYSFSHDCSAPRPGADYFAGCVEAHEWKALVWLMLVRRELLERNAIRFVEEPAHKDDVFCIEVALRARRVARLGDHLYARRIRDGSLMTAPDPLRDFSSYLQNALWAVAAGADGTLSSRARAALGAMVVAYLRAARKNLAAMTDGDRERLAAERPCEAALSELLSRTRSVEEFRRLENVLARREERIASLKASVERRGRKIASLQKEAKRLRRVNRLLRSSRSFRLGNALLALPRLLLGRKRKA
jgi:glycosyltransferase involved in cell wall biosynthesis